MPDNTVKLEIEIGDMEIQFEGPADFARQDLLPLIRGLVDALSELDDDFEEDAEEEGDEAEGSEEAEDTEPGKESGEKKS